MRHRQVKRATHKLRCSCLFSELCIGLNGLEIVRHARAPKKVRWASEHYVWFWSKEKIVGLIARACLSSNAAITDADAMYLMSGRCQ